MNQIDKILDHHRILLQENIIKIYKCIDKNMDIEPNDLKDIIDTIKRTN